jgi:hypothetical protein
MLDTPHSPPYALNGWSFRSSSGFEFVQLWDLGEVGLMEFVPVSSG